MSYDKRRRPSPFQSFDEGKSDSSGANTPGGNYSSTSGAGGGDDGDGGGDGSGSIVQAIGKAFLGLKELLAKSMFQVIFPDHLFIPKDAQPLDLRNVFSVAPGGTVRIIDFTCPAGAQTTIIGYAIFNDGLLASQFDFIPAVDGRRVYPFQGDPLDNFRIYLGASVDLGNQALFDGYLVLKPGQRLTWDAINRAVVSTTMGVRVKGYVRTAQFKQDRFGG